MTPYMDNAIVRHEVLKFLFVILPRDTSIFGEWSYVRFNIMLQSPHTISWFCFYFRFTLFLFCFVVLSGKMLAFSLYQALLHYYYLPTRTLLTIGNSTNFPNGSDINPRINVNWLTCDIFPLAPENAMIYNESEPDFGIIGDCE